MPLVVSAELAVEERLVVVRVEPRQRARDERLVELLRVLERGDRLRAVDDDVVLGVDELAAVRPHEPVRPVRVAGGVAEREAGRRALGLQRLAQLEEAGDVLRDRVEARGLDLALAVDDALPGGAHHDRDPLLVVHAVRLGRVVPAAVLVAEVVGEVGDVDQLVRILVRVLHRADDDVGTAADVGGHRRLGPHVLPAFGVDAHLDAGHLA